MSSRTQSLRSLILQQYEQDVPVRVLAEDHKVSVRTIYKWIKASDIDLHTEREVESVALLRERFVGHYLCSSRLPATSRSDCDLSMCSDHAVFGVAVLVVGHGVGVLELCDPHALQLVNVLRSDRRSIS
jgi:hypothetical protein